MPPPVCGAVTLVIVVKLSLKPFKNKQRFWTLPPFLTLGHPKVFEFSEKVCGYFPDPLNNVFLTNSGSEAADTSFKIALAYQKIRGKGGKQLIIGRDRGYHGVGFAAYFRLCLWLESDLWYGETGGIAKLTICRILSESG